VENPTEPIVKFLRKTLSRSYNTRTRDGRFITVKRYLYFKRGHRFPSGLLSMARKKGCRRSIIFKVNDTRLRPPVPKPLPKTMDHLKDFQKDAIEVALSHGNGIWYHPTGAGKTEMAIGLALRAAVPTLFLVNEKSLLLQASERWKGLTGTSARFVGQEPVVKSTGLYIGMFQTIYSRRHEPELARFLRKRIKCVITDECHILGARTFWEVMMLCEGAFYRIGMSATPLSRSDGMNIYTVAATGGIIHQIKINELTDGEDARLVSPKIVFYDYPGQEDVPWPGRWDLLYKKGIVRAKARNRAIIRLCKVATKPCLVFFEWKSHGYELRDELEAEDYKVEIVHGNVDGVERRKLVKRLDSGDIEILVASKVFQQGVDIPNLKSCINAAGMKSEIKSLQKLGRGMRKTDTKIDVEYFDLIDKHNDSLLTQSWARVETYEKAGLEVKVVKKLKEAKAWMIKS